MTAASNTAASGGFPDHATTAGAGIAIPAGATVVLPGRVDADAGPLGAPAKSQLRQTWDAFRDHRAAFVGLCVLITMILACTFLPFVLDAPDAIDYQVLSAQGPSARHLLGTDSLGRDVLSRLVNAGRVSLALGFIVAFAAATIGATVGVMAGYFGGRVDSVMMWIVNVLMTIPTLPLLIVIAVIMSNPTSKLGPLIRALPPVVRIAVVLSLLGWMGISRVVRSQVVSLRGQEFVEAAKALGGGHSRVMFIHILPNCVSVIAVFTTLQVSSAIIGEAALSYLGFGIPLPSASWGNMLAEGKSLVAILEYWWTVWFPALAIFTTVLSVNFIGDGVRDALDPKTMKR
jgi:peptide/nickel transport system permease protein